MCRVPKCRKPDLRPCAIVLPAMLFAMVAMLPLRPAVAGDASLIPREIKKTTDNIADMLNLHAKVGDVPDFVKRTRPDRSKLDFLPVGFPHDVRPLPAKTADQIQKLKAKLDAAAAAQLLPRAPLAPLELAAKIKAGAVKTPPSPPDKIQPDGAN